MMWGRCIQKFLRKRMCEQKLLRNFVIQILTLKLQLCNIRIFISTMFQNVCFVCCFCSHHVFMCSQINCICISSFVQFMLCAQLIIKLVNDGLKPAPGWILMQMEKCCWWAVQNGTVNSSSSKFVQGSKIYQLYSIKDSKRRFDAHKAGLSVPLRKVVQEIPQDNAIAKSMQQMNDKDLDFNFTILHGTTCTSLHTIWTL